jgi:hypothetical protein
MNGVANTYTISKIGAAYGHCRSMVFRGHDTHKRVNLIGTCTTKN